MSEIKVTFGALEAAGGNITGSASKVEGELDALKSRLAPLVSTWQGDAATTYNTLQRQWDEAAADLKQVLNQIGIAVHTANENYQAGEKANTARFQG